MQKYISVLLFFFTVQCFGQSTIVDKSFFNKADAFWSSVVSGKSVDYVQIKENPSYLLELSQVIDNADVSNLDENTLKAFYINAYNIAVIKTIVLNYPVQSTNQIPGFFDGVQHKFSGKYMTLNEFEKELILKRFNDPRLHFALVCGAKGCPPIINKAYRPEIIDLQLDEQYKAACNDPGFIRTQAGKNEVGLSKIFDWYASDFGKSKKAILGYINAKRDNKIDNGASVNYYDYDWSLNGLNSNSNSQPNSNDQGSNINTNNNTGTAATPVQNTADSQDLRFFVSALYDKGQFEVNLFNNLYHEIKKNDLNENVGSSTFFSTLTQVLIGVNKRFNAGFDIRLRSVRKNEIEPDSPFEVFKYASNQVTFQDEERFFLDNYGRVGLTALGPKIKYTPFRKFGNISFQQTLYLPIGKDLDGGDDSQDDKGYIDWDGAQFWTQMFFDHSLTSKFSLFVEADLNFENIGTKQALQFSTPITIIPSYFPNYKTTIYGLIGSAPQWYNLFPGDGETRLYNPFSQYGMGVKYLFAGKFQVEVLVTEFINSNSTESRAATYNLGLRYIHR